MQTYQGYVVLDICMQDINHCIELTLKMKLRWTLQTRQNFLFHASFRNFTPHAFRRCRKNSLPWKMATAKSKPHSTEGTRNLLRLGTKILKRCQWIPINKRNKGRAGDKLQRDEDKPMEIMNQYYFYIVKYGMVSRSMLALQRRTKGGRRNMR